MARSELVAYNTGMHDYTQGFKNSPGRAQLLDPEFATFAPPEVYAALKRDPERFGFFWQAGWDAAKKLNSL
jgi:hypothetical protein